MNHQAELNRLLNETIREFVKVNPKAQLSEVMDAVLDAHSDATPLWFEAKDQLAEVKA